MAVAVVVAVVVAASAAVVAQLAVAAVVAAALVSACPVVADHMDSSSLAACSTLPRLQSNLVGLQNCVINMIKIYLC